MFPPQPTELFRPYLLLGERILWTGQPKQGLSLSSKDGALIPFSLLWGGFAIFWNIEVWSIPSSAGGPDLLFRLFGLPFLVVGIYLIIGRFFHDSVLRKTIHYAVTDQRVLILRGSRLTALDLDRLPSLELTDFGDGTGTIAFEPGRSPFIGFGRTGFEYWVPALSPAPQFFRVPDPRRVYELIRSRPQT